MPARSRRNSKKSSQPPEDQGMSYLAPRVEERLLIEQLVSLQADTILCRSRGRAQLAGFLASQNPGKKVYCHYLDSHFANLAREYWDDADDPPEIVCSADLPEDQFDVCCLPIHKQGNAELNRELLQQAYVKLRTSGELYAAVDQPKDKWLHEQMQKLFDKVTRISKKKGVIYVGKKKAELKKVKNFAATVKVMLGDQNVELQTRPGVFSHRKLDDGAWALIKSLTVKRGMHIMDLGCGCGAVGIAAMLSAKEIHVTAVDSDARAVECTRQNAEANLNEEQQARFKVVQTHTGELNAQNQFDIVAANPPYFAKFQIAELFINAAKACLKMGGELVLVTKMPEWYEEHLPHFLQQVTIHEVGHYSIVTGKNSPKAQRKRT